MPKLQTKGDAQLIWDAVNVAIAAGVGFCITVIALYFLLYPENEKEQKK